MKIEQALLPPHIQRVLPDLMRLDSAQRLSLIHLLSEGSTKETELKQAIQTGLDSPLVTDFDFDNHLEALKTNG